MSPFDWQMRVVRAWLGTLRAFETHRLGSGVDGWNDYCRASLGTCQSGNLPRNLAITLRDFGARELLTRPGRSLRYPRERLISALPLLLSESASLLDPCAANALAVTPKTSWRDAVQVFLRNGSATPSEGTTPGCVMTSPLGVWVGMEGEHHLHRIGAGGGEVAFIESGVLGR